MFRKDGSYFGTLCALDPKPAQLGNEKFSIFQLLAALIGLQLEQQERSLRQEEALLDAEQTAELRETFIGVLGHDLRNPLSAVIINAQSLLKMEELGEKPTKVARRIAQSAERMSSMVSDLLDFTRGRLGGGVPLQLSAGDASELVRNVVEELQAANPERIFEVVVPPELEPILWDIGRVAQVFSNLIGNAIGHSPEGTPVRISLTTTAERAVFATHNWGTAIPTDKLPRLFEPFRRSVEAATGSNSGLGLGLFISKQILDAHGGSLTVNSTEEDGTTFTASLPRRAQS